MAVQNKLPSVKVGLSESHQDILADLQENGNKSKFSYLLKYDGRVLKDLDLIVLQATDNLEFRDEQAINSSQLRMQHTEDYDFYEDKQRMQQKRESLVKLKVDPAYKFQWDMYLWMEESNDDSFDEANCDV